MRMSKLLAYEETSYRCHLPMVYLPQHVGAHDGIHIGGGGGGGGGAQHVGAHCIGQTGAGGGGI